MLNPAGELSRIIPLSIVAGLSPISYLKSQAISDGSSEDATLKSYKDFRTYTELFKREIEVPDDEEDIDQIVQDIKKRYTIDRGDDADE